MNTQVVAPRSSRREVIAVAAVFLVLISISAALLAQRQRIDTMPRLYDWQVSAFFDLGETDRAIYNSLSSAVDELWYIHNDNLLFYGDSEGVDMWPSIEELGEYYVLPPFAVDLFWSLHGEVEWSRVASFDFEGSTVYFGRGGDVEDQSAYLLSLSHVHKGAIYANGASIWIHPDANIDPPQTVVRDSLIKNGWNEVVPYTGATEVQRLRGGRS
ncbi:MAG: hypothetical protein DHS20C12_15890 [Pseudohongiella sp.]|nr:MAG: hypothetical protein DHS20C12_15890 [Pseudohongiella sp.]